MTRIPKFLAAFALVLLAVTACSSEQPDTGGVATGTDVAAAPTTINSTDVPTESPNVTPPADTAAQEPAADTSSGAVLPAPNRDDVNVDARDFEQDGQYFFTSPSGNAHCAFHSRNAPGTDVGCQVRYSVPGNTGKVCGNVANNTYGVQIRSGGTVEQICTNQGIFVADDTRVLEYGQTIGVQGDICRSTEAGITCYSGSGSGFMISRDANVAF